MNKRRFDLDQHGAFVVAMLVFVLLALFFGHKCGWIIGG